MASQVMQWFSPVYVNGRDARLCLRYSSGSSLLGHFADAAVGAGCVECA